MSKIIRVPIEKELERHIWFPDIHVPEHDERAYNAILSYASDHKYDRAGQIGDWISFKNISPHEVKNHQLRKIEGRRLEKDFIAGEKSAKEMAEALGKNIPFDWIQGNHEYWLTRYLDQHPELEGVPSFDVVARMQKFLPKLNWIPFWSKGLVLQVGKAKFIHGVVKGATTGVNVLKKYGGNVFFGHGHHVEVVPHTTLEDETCRCAVAIGGLQKPSVDFMQGSPNRWQKAFLEIFFFKNGDFSFYTPMLFNGRFIAPSGKVYKG